MLRNSIWFKSDNYSGHYLKIHYVYRHISNVIMKYLLDRKIFRMKIV
jgi:hypothetical protein